MTNERIKEIADFFYSSDDIEDVPLRLAMSVGQFKGADLTKEDCIELLTILNNSDNLKEDLATFLEELQI